MINLVINCITGQQKYSTFICETCYFLWKMKSNTFMCNQIIGKWNTFLYTYIRYTLYAQSNMPEFYVPWCELPVFLQHGDVIKWKHFPRYWSFVRGIHRWPMNSHHKGQWWGALKFSLICAWTNTWANNREAGNLRRYRAHYDVIVMSWCELLVFL